MTATALTEFEPCSKPHNARPVIQWDLIKCQPIFLHDLNPLGRKLIVRFAANIASKVVGSSPIWVAFFMEKIPNPPKHN